MSEHPGYTQGGDAQAIRRLASDYYGSYQAMFEAHGWPERGDMMLPTVQSRVVELYGSIRSFEEAHRYSAHGMPPMAAIMSDLPNVWLTSFYGFDPEEWGMLGFTDEARRRNFLNGTRPGVLVVVYASGKASKDELRKVVGIQQCSHRIGYSEQFVAPATWREKQDNPDYVGKWNFAVEATRAWRVTPESRMHIEEFAPEATATKAWLHIARQAVPLSHSEAMNILKLDLQEVDVYGQDPIIGASPASAKEILSPSRPGPVSQNAFVTRESEGPKHLYLLVMQGDTDALLGRAALGKKIVKAGFSRSPQTRCNDHNRTLPRCAFRWRVHRSGEKSGYDPYPDSDHAKAGERAMQEVLCRSPAGKSLGREFFLAEPKLIDMAWEEGNRAAKGYGR